jgi:invasion protein IalB
MWKSAKLLICLAVLWAAGSVAATAASKTQKTFGPWSVDCAESDKGDVRCTLRFALVNKKSKSVVFGWSIVPGTGEAANKAVLQTPTGILLGDGIQIQFPEADPTKAAFRICGPRYCFAEFDFTQAWLDSFEAQKSLSVAFRNGKGQELKYPVNLERFGEAYKFYTQQLQKKKQ